MTNTAIQIENLSKRYRLGGHQASYQTLRESLVSAVTFKRSKHQRSNEIWALKDVSFMIQQGDVLGIIGRNGAGKSTLLKIISRITRPTSGQVRLRGRVGSLLEVGTGFHPELTGRENIYLNGAILGMRKTEIERKFDEIVAFAEIEQFLDTPVKHYSSGMYMRLAFAVAAHLESEILLVDEVLAVGDAAFQKKCMGKMGDVAKGGRTVLFVSHNMAAVQNLCNYTVVLTRGELTGPMKTPEGIRFYMGNASIRRSRWKNDQKLVVNDLVLSSATIIQDKMETDILRISAPFYIRFELSPSASSRDSLFGIQIMDSMGTIIYHSLDVYSDEPIDGPRRGARIMRIPAYGLAVGEYHLSYWLGHPEQGVWDHAADILTWNVQADCPIMVKYPENLWKGVVGPGLAWWKLEPDLPSSSNVPG